MAAVGFEPTPLSRLVPKTSALDRSATLPTCDLAHKSERETGLYIYIHVLTSKDPTGDPIGNDLYWQLLLIILIN